jgi:PAS domain S-box-containing protein
MEDKSLNYLFHEILDKVLHLSENPTQFASYLTSQIRELIGARTILIAVKTETDETQIFSVYPERKKEWCHNDKVIELIELSFCEKEVRFWNSETDKVRVSQLVVDLELTQSIIIPLITGDRLVGTILLLDIMDMYSIDALLNLLNELSGVFALIVRNSLLYSNLESLVESKTKELNARNQELSEGEKKFRAVFENSVIGMSLTTLKGKMNPNKAFCQMVGYSKEELSELTWTDISHEDDIERGFKAVQTVLNSDSESFSLEHRFIHKNGEIVWVDISSTLQYDSLGNPISFITSINNITEQKQNKQYLIESEANFRAIFENNSAAIAIIEPDTTISMVNEAYCKLSGYTAEEVVGMSWTAQIPPEDLERLKEYNRIRLSSPSEAPEKYEFTFYRKDGEIRSALMSVSLIEESKKVITSFIDITESKEVTEKLLLSQRMLAETERIGKVGGWQLDIETGIQTWTEEIYTIHELPTDFIATGENAILFYTPESQLIVRNAVQRTLDYGEPFDIEAEIITSKGNRKNIQTIGQADFENHRIYGFFQDITERKQIEIALQESEGKYHRITDNISDVVWTSDLELNINYVSPSVERLLGLTEEEHLNRTQEQKFPPESLLILQKGLMEEMEKESNPAYAKNRTRSFEVEYFRADGTRIWVEISVSFLRDELGRPIGLQGMTRDISDKRRAERELLASEEKFRKAFFTSPESITITSIETGVYKEVNKGFTHTFGYDANEVIGRKSMELDIWYNVSDRIHVVNELKSKGTIENYICRLRKKDGEIIYGMLSGSFIELDAEKHVLLITRDITRIKNVEHALKESNERLNVILESTPIAIWDWDVTTDKWYATSKYYTMLGYEVERDYPDRQVWINRIHPDDRQVVAEKISKVLSHSDENYNYEARMLHADGSYRWQTVIGHAVERDEDNKASRLIGVRIDIHDRKKAELALRESEQKLSALFSSMTEMVVIHELVFNEMNEAINYRIIDCNQMFTTLTGITKENAIGRLGSEVYNSPQPPYLDIYTEVALTGEPNEFNVHYIPLDKHFMVSVVSPQQNVFATITSDITVIKQVHDEISAKNKELENYLYIASHDLRSPLVNIQGFSERLQRQTGEIATLLDSQNSEQSKLAKLTGDDIPKSIKFILTNVQKMDTLINGLLQLSRTGRIALNLNKVDMNELIHTVLSQYNFELTEFNVNLHLGKMLDCYGDQNQLNQLFSNIIGNALKYRGKGRGLDVEITSKQNYSRVIYCIKDTGIGINARHLEKIWDVFYRVDASNPESGEGLGLSLAKRIVEKHKGKVWVESVEGKGSTFFVELHMTEFNS